MKKLFYYLAILAIGISSIKAQTLIAEYERLTIEVENEEEDLKNLKIVGQEQYEKLKEFTSKPTSFVLHYSQGVSEFMEKPFEPKEEKIEMGDMKMTMIVTPNEHIGFKDFNSNQLISNEYIMQKAFLMEESMPNLDWQIQEETQKFGDFTAQKATLKKDGKEIIAYYTEEIPIPDGLIHIMDCQDLSYISKPKIMYIA